MLNIWNIALSHCANSKRVTSESEASVAADACRLFYDTALLSTLEETPWGFAQKRRTLQLVRRQEALDYTNVYRYPQDCLRILKIIPNINESNFNSIVDFPARTSLDDARPVNLNEDYTHRIVDNLGVSIDDIAYEISADDEGKTVLTNYNPAVIKYISRVEDVSLFPSLFSLALSYKLASFILPTVSQGNIQQLLGNIEQKYDSTIEFAKKNTGNEDKAVVMNGFDKYSRARRR